MIAHAGGWDEILIPSVIVLLVFFWGTRKKPPPDDDETPEADRPQKGAP